MTGGGRTTLPLGLMLQQRTTWGEVSGKRAEPVAQVSSQGEAKQGLCAGGGRGRGAGDRGHEAEHADGDPLSCGAAAGSTGL